MILAGSLPPPSLVDEVVAGLGPDPQGVPVAW